MEPFIFVVDNIGWFNDVILELSYMVKGVPQGSILGPTVFACF